MEGENLPVAMRILFLMTSLALISFLPESVSSTLDTSSGTVPVAVRVNLTTSAAKGNFCNTRYAAKYSSSRRRNRKSCYESMFTYVPNHKLAVLHQRDPTTIFSQQETTGNSTFRAEVDVLRLFKEGITEDPLGALKSWTSNDSSACHWKGVTCDFNSKRIIALKLQNLSLVRSISWLLGSLQYLQNLDLSGNSFNGEIPMSLTNSSNLSHLALSDNNLTGQIPSQLGDLLRLKHLNLSYNALLGGIIPASLGNCSLLQVLFLQLTNIEGEIPYTVGKLTHLEIIDLEGTANSGAIPRSLGNCSFLTDVSMGNVFGNSETKISGLRGEIPMEIGSLTRLNNLAILGSNIGGRFPGWLANLTRLTTLTLSHSSFTGEIPHFLGKLPLAGFDGEYNNLTGAFPTFLINLLQLELALYSWK